MAALMVFTVSYRGIRLKVRLLPTIVDVHREFKTGAAPKRRTHVNAFFVPTHHTDARFVGTIVVPSNGRLAELIPHEVTHAVLFKKRRGLRWDCEYLPTSIGIITARITRRIARKYEVNYE